MPALWVGSNSLPFCRVEKTDREVLMKIQTTALLSLFLLGACSSVKKETSAEVTQQIKEQRAQRVASSMMSALDERDWKKFEESFAHKTVVITEEPLLLTPEEITARAKPFVEYFSSTRHELSDFKLEEKNERIIGTAKMDANYWRNRTLSSDLATLEGKYEFEFTQDGDEYKIMRMRLLSDKKEGDVKILEKAMAKIPRTKGSYRVEVVDIPSNNGKLMRGWVYIPTGKIRDVVIINGNLGNVKEQGSLLYGQELAKLGFGTLVFDFVNFGESEGTVRNLEDPGQKIDDFRGAVNFVANHQAFSGAKISLLGLGASAGYAAAEAVNDPRVKKLIMVAPWLQDAEVIQAEESLVKDKLGMGREASHQFVQDQVLTYVPVVSYEDPSAVISSDSQMEIDYYLNPDRGNIPQWRNRFATMGWGPWLNFDSTSAGARVNVPTLILRAKGSKHTAGLQEFVGKMRTQPQIHSMAVQPYDFYDRPMVVEETVKKIESFLI